jgi:predicted SAM-dependent methyltransferase
VRPILAPLAPVGLGAGSAPSFSTITAAYQAAETIAETVDSALAQTVPPLEVIVVDDGSTDGTADALVPYRDRIILLSQENRGTAAALNVATRHAHGDFVVILDADDVAAPERIEALTELAAGRSDLDILSTDAYLEAAGEIVGRFFETTPFAITDQRLAILERCFIAWPAVRREVLLAAGGLNESLRIGHDWECWIRLLHAGATAGAVDEPLLRYRVDTRSLTGDRVGALRDRVQVLELASQLDLSTEERFAVGRYLRRRRTRVVLAETEQALRGRADDARRRALQAAVAAGVPSHLRVKALAAVVAPALAGKRLERIAEKTGRSRITRDLPSAGGNSSCAEEIRRPEAPRRPLERLRDSSRRRVSKLGHRLSDQKDFAQYMAAHSIRKLQIGTGPNPLPGWLNTDLHPEIYPDWRDEIFFLDATRDFPLPDQSFDYVFSEHQIEHVSQADACHMLRECFRVLRNGGRIRLATPDLTALIALYREPLDPTGQHYLDWVTAKLGLQHPKEVTRCHVVNQMFYAYGHRFIYDAPALAELLEEAGFVDVVRCMPRVSEDPALVGLEAHGRAIGDEAVNRFETMVLEARRPTPG